jgi:hypothetical protein
MATKRQKRNDNRKNGGIGRYSDSTTIRRLLSGAASSNLPLHKATQIMKSRMWISLEAAR